MREETVRKWIEKAARELKMSPRRLPPVELLQEVPKGKGEYWLGDAIYRNGRIRVLTDLPPREVKKTIKHELAHWKLHRDLPDKEYCEEIVSRELDVAFLVDGRATMDELVTIMETVMEAGGISPRKAIALVTSVAEERGVPKSTITRAKRLARQYFYRRG